MKIAVVGCTGKLGTTVMKNILNRENLVLRYAIARRIRDYPKSKFLYAVFVVETFLVNIKYYLQTVKMKSCHLNIKYHPENHLQTERLKLQSGRQNQKRGCIIWMISAGIRIDNI